MKSFTKREIIVMLMSLLVVVAAGAYALNVRHTQSARNAINNLSLHAKDEQLDGLTAYNTTICAEYRKLYASYQEVVALAPTAHGASYALPGSAKGEVDSCYQL